jgi:hypothetical protein
VTLWKDSRGTNNGFSADLFDAETGLAQVERAGPPVGYASAAAAMAFTAAVIGGLTAPGVHLAGYLLGAPLTAISVALFRHKDIRGRSSSWYVPSRPIQRLVRVALVTGMAAGAWHAFWLATEIAK